MPAPASKIEERQSPLKSVDTTWKQKEKKNYAALLLNLYTQNLDSLCIPGPLCIPECLSWVHQLQPWPLSWCHHTWPVVRRHEANRCQFEVIQLKPFYHEDLEITHRFLKADGQIHHGHIGGGDTEGHASKLAETGSNKHQNMFGLQKGEAKNRKDIKYLNFP